MTTILTIHDIFVPQVEDPSTRYASKYINIYIHLSKHIFPSPHSAHYIYISRYNFFVPIRVLYIEMVMMKSFLTSVIFGLLLCAISNAAAAQLPLPSQTTYYALPIPSISAEQHALNMLNEAVTETKALPINDNNSNSNSNSNSGISGYISPKPAFVAKMSQVPERYRYGKNKPPMNATETEEDKLPMNATETGITRT